MVEKYIEKFQKEYKKQPIDNAIARVGINEAVLNNEVIKKHNFVFSNEIEIPEITNQKNSGRCWIFAALNVSRAIVMKKLNVEKLEFSENYLLFYAKMEKANSFLEHIIASAKEEEEHSRIFDMLMNGPCDDGGYYKWVQALAEKYGVVPIEIMPETFNSSKTASMIMQLNIRLRKYGYILRNKVRNDASNEEIAKIKEQALYECYQICTKCLGKLPEKFDYEYRDKDKKFHKLKDMTPIKFYNEYVKETYDELIPLSNDPRRTDKYGKVIEFKYLNAIFEKGNEWTLNVPLEEMKKATIESIKAGVPVWFACDVQKDSHYELGIFDTELYNFNESLTDLGEFSRSDRLNARETNMTHAMAFIGVDLDENGNPIKWKVENSWGEKYGKKGIFSMADNWFNQHTFQVIVPRRFVDEKYLKGIEEEHIIAQPWDPIS